MESRLLIAISGGLDSVVLTHLCHKLGLSFALAHCNFNLRGMESDSDEDFVLELAENLDLEIFIESFDTEAYAKNQKLSIQMAARELRYNWFSEVSSSLGFDYILTAHHAGDNLETVLINLSRGTGLKGLTGIPEVNGNIVRPLLPFSREALEHYAHEHKIRWQEDSSNATNKYLRNKLRHEVIPILKDINPELHKNFKTTLEHLNAASEIIDDSIKALSKRAIDSSENAISKYRISELKTLKNPKAYLYELLKDYGFKAWEDVSDLLDAQSGKQVFSATHCLLKDRDYLILTEISEKGQHKEILISAQTETLQTPAGTVTFEKNAEISALTNNTIFVDKDRLKYPLKLRKWGTGDAFHPFGMTGKKKLSKFFKDEKLSLIEKEQVWLLCSQDKIVWVIGMRADERFKVTEQTKHILKIELAVPSKEFGTPKD
ncbi:tRNA lysidine(34) synthetase TilS [Subsaximicrobium wynnwilliamsii]|uniref:tRNA(Ile)-lysidine synthase n=1 Tax=Subsaximicrobium wynnwilliamsii TaxID=291179 RepID=A0A5C6ZLF8_9FLAO|nr:tRNA lysidine(34) synthetase TilS [Subsaximicrobium wynnwilliamsii]TXD84199.1 tRNA lysidine(34) synthetase TilS [Subsaximicrobium wynnwilliamsii]TXD89820.1 tRNA lysidine(34) synthetase TilS [Subsaximicrobium wynnwilliamsii]TXE03911.1 tRNA lysidine(34) synthetase TilS [Subsaximicrobium wynnwilliamsii]